MSKAKKVVTILIIITIILIISLEKGFFRVDKNKSVVEQSSGRSFHAETA